MSTSAASPDVFQCYSLALYPSTLHAAPGLRAVGMVAALVMLVLVALVMLVLVALVMLVLVAVVMLGVGKPGTIEQTG